MYRDVTELRQFYRSPLGRATARLLRHVMTRFWPEPQPHHVFVGVGYALPYLEKVDTAQSFAVMTATQGLVRWPSEGPCRTVLTEDHVLPFPEQSIDRLLLVHAVENADYLKELMHEVWRVLAPNGRVLMVVPNRSGLWARSDKTPFGHGRSFTMKQVRQLLRAEQFVIERHERALYLPPLPWRSMVVLAGLMEKLGAFLLPKNGGVLVVEASKQLYAVTPLKVSAKPMPATAPAWDATPVPTG
jgi:SAM-dependent methyltransferase